MASAETISSLATAGGTLVLAVATFASVRSANRAARAAERSLLEGLRPVLVSSRFHDPPEKIFFIDRHFVRVDGGRAVIEQHDEVIYAAIALRNVGRGMAVLHGWRARRGSTAEAPEMDPDPVQYRRLNRDIYVPSGDLGFWQGAVRDASDPLFAELCQVAVNGEPFMVDLLYGDHEGGQRTVSRFSALPHRDENGALSWTAAVSRHMHIDGAEPR